MNSVCVTPAFSALACSVATPGARENGKLQQQNGHEGVTQVIRSIPDSIEGKRLKEPESTGEGGREESWK